MGWLAASQQRGDNGSLYAGAFPAGTVVAQKNGWLRAARHGAALIYAPSGTRIVVVMTYDERGVSLAQARAFAARVAAVR